MVSHCIHGSLGQADDDSEYGRRAGKPALAERQDPHLLVGSLIKG